MSSNYLTADNGVSSGVTGITQSAGNDGTLQIRTTTSGGTATTALTINNNQQVTFANAIVPNNTSGIVGVTDGSNANAGVVGEYISAQVTAPTTGLTSTSTTNVTSISLTAGDWDVWGVVSYSYNTGTIATKTFAGISTTSSTLSSAAAGYSALIDATQTAGDGLTMVAPPLRINVSTTTTVYLIGYCTFTVSTAGIGGFIRARRVR